ncbi:MAG TPA: acetolactate synthase small subunit [Desulfomonilaceae bacterium]|nr:acetolactate synthase small subunit [Desulfomonilaceae bacterium]
MENRHVISVLVENKPGVLARVSGMFSGRGFNIHSLAVAPSQDAEYSRMTIVTHGNVQIIEQIIKQLRKLINVVRVQDLALGEYVDREMVLIRVRATAAKRAEVLRITDIFRGKVVDVSHDTITLEVSGTQSKIDAILELLAPLGITELIRTGTIAIPRAKKVLKTGDSLE